MGHHAQTMQLVAQRDYIHRKPAIEVHMAQLFTFIVQGTRTPCCQNDAAGNTQLKWKQKRTRNLQRPCLFLGVFPQIAESYRGSNF